MNLPGAQRSFGMEGRNRGRLDKAIMVTVLAVLDSSETLAFCLAIVDLHLACIYMRQNLTSMIIGG